MLGIACEVILVIYFVRKRGFGWVRGVNPEPVRGYWPLRIGSGAPRLLKNPNWLQNQGPRLVSSYSDYLELENSKSLPVLEKIITTTSASQRIESF
jgi:hypothetical protein